MQSIADFIKLHGVSMTATPVPVNPHMESDPDSRWSKEASHFLVTLEKSGGRPMVTYYSVGVGIVESWVANHGKTRFGLASFNRADFKRNPRTIAAREFFDANKGDYRPDLSSVLDCLVCDSACVENAPTFEDFAADLGYDPDSRKAERIFHTCCLQSRALRALLGPAEYNTLIFETERE